MRVCVLFALLLTGCPKESGELESPVAKSTVRQFEMIERQIQIFAAEHQRAPTPEEGLGILFDDTIPKDGWGNDIHYEAPGPDGWAFDLVSHGADSAEGGKGDATDLRWSSLAPSDG